MCVSGVRTLGIHARQRRCVGRGSDVRVAKVAEYAARVCRPIADVPMGTEQGSGVAKTCLRRAVICWLDTRASLIGRRTFLIEAASKVSPAAVAGWRRQVLRSDVIRNLCRIRAGVPPARWKRPGPESVDQLFLLAQPCVSNSSHKHVNSRCGRRADVLAHSRHLQSCQRG